MKKGFTLIELLAVIIILAIVALIAIPVVLNVIEDARKQTAESETKIVFKGIENYCKIVESKEHLGEDISSDINCKNKTSFTNEEVSKMVNLANSTLLYANYDGTNASVSILNNGYICEGSINGTSCAKEGNIKNVEVTEDSIVINDNVLNNLNNYEIYGNSVQNGTPTTNTYVAVESVGTLITDETDVNHGKYKIPIKVTIGEEENIYNIYLDEPLRKIGEYEDYIDFNNKQVHRVIKEVIYDGTESWEVVGTVGTAYGYYGIKIGEYGSVVANVGLNTHFERTSITSSNTNIGFNIINSSGYKKLVLP